MERQEKIENLISKMNDGDNFACLDFVITDDESIYISDKLTQSKKTTNPKV